MLSDFCAILVQSRAILLVVRCGSMSAARRLRDKNLGESLMR